MADILARFSVNGIWFFAAEMQSSVVSLGGHDASCEISCRMRQADMPELSRAALPNESGNITCVVIGSNGDRLIGELGSLDITYPRFDGFPCQVLMSLHGPRAESPQDAVAGRSGAFGAEDGG